MPLYSYKVIDKTGTAREGELTADNEEKLLDKLRSMDYTIIDIRETEGKAEEDVLTQDMGFGFDMGISQKDLAFFTRQLSITLNAGLPLTRIITTLYNQTSSRGLKKVIHQVGKDIQLGHSLTDAMTKHGDVFDQLYLSMIAVGEASGSLPSNVARLADMMEKDRAVRRKIRSAMAYPSFIIAFSVILSYVLVAFLMPGFVPVFEGAGIDIAADYPLTNLLVQASRIATNPYIVGATIALLVILIILAEIMSRSDKGRYVIDYVKFNFPFVSAMIRIGAVARFCRAFATLTKSGVPLLKAMNLVSGASGNMVVTRSVEKMSHEIQEGEKLSQAMKRTKIFPELVNQMVSIGEEAGTMPEMFEKTGEYFEQELEGSIEALTSIMEPAMMIVVGIIVGVFVMGILLPILGIASRFGA